MATTNSIMVQRRKQYGVVRYDDPTIFIHIRSCNKCEEYFPIAEFNYQLADKIKKRICKYCQQKQQTQTRRKKRDKPLTSLISMKW